MPNKRSKSKAHKKPKKNEKSKLNPSDIVKLIDSMERENLGIEAKKFLLYNMERMVYGPDDSNEFIIFCLSTYFALGDEVYLTMTILYELAPIQFIREKALEDFQINAGISDKLVQLIEVKTENISPQNKIVILEMDESCLQPEMKYNENLDCIIGYEDDGKTRTRAPARFVTNIWIHSVGGTWMLPLCFIFTNNSASPDQIKTLLFESVLKLEKIGLDVVGVVTKMRQNFYDVMKQLDVTPTDPTFQVGSKELLFLFDVPQLMNVTRNILMKYQLKFDEYETSWKDVKALFVKECRQPSLKKSKLSMKHIKPGKKERTVPRYAIETLSNTVATEIKSLVSAGQLSATANGTAEIIDLFDKLFDMFNSHSETCLNEFNCSFKGSKHQYKFIEKVVDFFTRLRVFDNEGKDSTDQVKFIDCWLITIRAMMKLWDRVKVKGHLYLLTRNVNCEVLDKSMNFLRLPFFCSCKDPTPASFLDMFSEFFINSYFASENLLNEDEEFHLEDYAKKVYKRIPPVRHDLGNKENNSPNQDNQA